MFYFACPGVGGRHFASSDIESFPSYFANSEAVEALTWSISFFAKSEVMQTLKKSGSHFASSETLKLCHNLFFLHKTISQANSVVECSLLCKLRQCKLLHEVFLTLQALK